MNLGKNFCLVGLAQMDPTEPQLESDQVLCFHSNMPPPGSPPELHVCNTCFPVSPIV